MKAVKKIQGITLISLVITIIVLTILTSVSVSVIIGNNGLIEESVKARESLKIKEIKEKIGLELIKSKYINKDGKKGLDIDKAREMINEKYGTLEDDNDTITLDKEKSGVTGTLSLEDVYEGSFSDVNNTPSVIAQNTPVGTKIGTTTVDGQKLDWYLFDTDTTNGKAYLVSTPTYWVPDTTKAVNGAWVPKLVASPDSKTGAMNQAIQKKASATSGDYSYSYDSSKVTYTPSPNTLSYYKSVNSQWSDKRGSTAFASLNENEQSACYLADADIFAGIKDQVNKAEGNLKGKIQTLVGGASAEQWCKAYNKQSAAKDHKITCEYRATSVLGYIYKVNDKQSTVSNDDYWTGTNTIFGNDIYGAANNNGNKTNNPFYTGTGWWLASPSAYTSHDMCYVLGYASYLSFSANAFYNYRFSLFASVAL